MADQEPRSLIRHTDLDEAAALEIGRAFLSAQRAAAEIVANAERRAAALVGASDRSPVTITDHPAGSSAAERSDPAAVAARIEEIEASLRASQAKLLSLLDDAGSSLSAEPASQEEAPPAWIDLTEPTSPEAGPADAGALGEAGLPDLDRGGRPADARPPEGAAPDPETSTAVGEDATQEPQARQAVSESSGASSAGGYLAELPPPTEFDLDAHRKRVDAASAGVLGDSPAAFVTGDARTVDVWSPPAGTPGHPPLVEPVEERSSPHEGTEPGLWAAPHPSQAVDPAAAGTMVESHQPVGSWAAPSPVNLLSWASPDPGSRPDPSTPAQKQTAEAEAGPASPPPDPARGTANWKANLIAAAIVIVVVILLITLVIPHL